MFVAFGLKHLDWRTREYMWLFEYDNIALHKFLACHHLSLRGSPFLTVTINEKKNSTYVIYIDYLPAFHNIIRRNYIELRFFFFYPQNCSNRPTWLKNMIFLLLQMDPLGLFLKMGNVYRKNKCSMRRMMNPNNIPTPRRMNTPVTAATPSGLGWAISVASLKHGSPPYHFSCRMSM